MLLLFPQLHLVKLCISMEKKNSAIPSDLRYMVYENIWANTWIVIFTKLTHNNVHK